MNPLKVNKYWIIASVMSESMVHQKITYFLLPRLFGIEYKHLYTGEEPLT